MELRHEEYDRAIQVMQHAVAEPAQAIQRRRQAEAQGRALGGLKGGKQQQEMQAGIPVQVGRCACVCVCLLEWRECTQLVEPCMEVLMLVTEWDVCMYVWMDPTPLADANDNAHHESTHLTRTG